MAFDGEWQSVFDIENKMQVIIITLCLVGATQAGLGKRAETMIMKNTPGCENYNSVRNFSVDACCPSLFSPISKKSLKICKDECRSKGFCCFAECHLKENQMSDDSGKFDASKTKEHLKSLAKESNYPVDVIVDNCTEKASRSLEEIKKKNPKKDLCQFENIAFTKCLSKEITINCPDWTKSSECESLMIFIKTCPFYNSLKFNGPGNSRGKNNKGEKKGGKENEEEMEEKTGDKKDQDEEKEE